MSYYENPNWEKYYKELSPADRRDMFDEIASLGDDGGNELRKELYKSRHTNPKHPDRVVDNGIWQIVVLPSHKRGLFSPKKYTSTLILESMTALGITEDNLSDEVKTGVVYWEIRNVCRRYFSTCTGPNYAKKFFGIKASTDDEKLVKTAQDVLLMSETIPEKFGLTKECKVFSDAIKDELFCYYPNGEEVYKEVKNSAKK